MDFLKKYKKIIIIILIVISILLTLKFSVFDINVNIQGKDIVNKRIQSSKFKDLKIGDLVRVHTLDKNNNKIIMIAIVNENPKKNEGDYGGFVYENNDIDRDNYVVFYAKDIKELIDDKVDDKLISEFKFRDLKQGTVVKNGIMVDGIEKEIMIVAKNVTRNINNESTPYEYLGCLYPEGYLGDEYNIFFNAKDITEIIKKENTLNDTLEINDDNIKVGTVIKTQDNTIMIIAKDITLDNEHYDYMGINYDDNIDGFKFLNLNDIKEIIETIE